MAGILLSAGPIATIDSVKKSSRIFLFAMSKNKFETAAGKLQALHLGALHFLKGKQSPVFIKRLPSEVGPLLLEGNCEDLCNEEEYVERFSLPSPMSITDHVKEAVISMGWVSRELFSAWSTWSAKPAPGPCVEEKYEPDYEQGLVDYHQQEFNQE